MIKIIDQPPIKFDEIVRTTVIKTVAEFGFVFEEEILPLPDKELNAAFYRKRKGIAEEISIFRRDYSDEYKDETDDEVEKEPHISSDNSGFTWISRHWFQILVISHYAHRYLLTTGEVGIGRNGEQYWYFEDEEDLRKLLVEKIILLLQTVVIKDFDEQLEDGLEYLKEVKNNRATEILDVPSQIAFVKKADAIEAVITKITEENVDIDYLKRVFEVGKKIAEADQEYGHLVSKLTYRVITNNSQLVKAIETHPSFKQEFPDLIVIFEDEWE